MFLANHFHNPTKACPIFNLSVVATEFPVYCTRAIQNVGQACPVHFCMKQAVFFPRGWVRTSLPPLPLPGSGQPPAALPAGRWLLYSALGLRDGSLMPRVRKRVESYIPVVHWLGFGCIRPVRVANCLQTQGWWYHALEGGPGDTVAVNPVLPVWH